MHNASWKGHADIVDMLLLKGADKTIKNNEGQTAYDLSVRFPEVGRLLQTHNGEWERQEEWWIEGRMMDWGKNDGLREEWFLLSFSAADDDEYGGEDDSD